MSEDEAPSSNRIGQALAMIQAFGPEDEANLLDLDDALKGIAAVPGSEVLIEPLFHLVERCAAIDLGSPGPVVHALEGFLGRGYEARLIASIDRLPTVYSLWMLNRLINVAAGEDRDDLLGILKRAANRRDSLPEVLDMANEMLAFQLGGK